MYLGQEEKEGNRTRKILLPQKVNLRISPTSSRILILFTLCKCQLTKSQLPCDALHAARVAGCDAPRKKADVRDERHVRDPEFTMLLASFILFFLKIIIYLFIYPIILIR